MARRGRKRKQGHRYPSGERHKASPSKIREDVVSAAHEARERVLGLSAQQAATMRETTELGRLHATRQITLQHCVAGEQYRDVYTAYRRAMQSRGYPVSSELDHGRSYQGEETTEEAERFLRAKRRFHECYKALDPELTGDIYASAIVDAVVLNDWRITDMLSSLKVGLAKLAEHFHVPDYKEGVDSEGKSNEIREIEAGPARQAAAGAS